MIIKHPDIDNLAKSIVTSHHDMSKLSGGETRWKMSSFLQIQDGHEKKIIYYKIKMELKKIILFGRNKNYGRNLKYLEIQSCNDFASQTEISAPCSGWFEKIESLSTTKGTSFPWARILFYSLFWWDWVNTYIYMLICENSFWEK